MTTFPKMSERIDKCLEFLEQFHDESGKVNCERMRREFEELRTDAYRYRWLQSDGDKACGLVRDAYSDWDGEQGTWAEALDIEIDNARGIPAGRLPCPCGLIAQVPGAPCDRCGRPPRSAP